jgi:hypothetical protein
MVNLIREREIFKAQHDTMRLRLEEETKRVVNL